MKTLIASMALAFSTACGVLDPCPGQQDCGHGSCAPTSASCCPSGTQYCDAPYTCGSDNLCHGSGGGGCTYYVSANGCTVGYSTVSYCGSNYSVCNGYYQTAVASQCTKILDNCR
jgi:hypothetical protein